MMDAFTTSDTFPYARHYRLGRPPINYIRNSVKVVVDAYDGTTTFYVFDDARSDHRRVSSALSVAVQGRVARCRRRFASTSAIRSCC